MTDTRTSSDGTTTGTGSSGSGCTRITDGYTTFDPGKSRLIFRTEIPQLFEGKVTVQLGPVANATVKLSQLKQFTLRMEQGTYTQPPSNIISTIPDGFEKAGEMTFNGETRWIAKAKETQTQLSPSVRVLLPYSVDGGTKVYFETNLMVSYRAPTSSPGEACYGALDDAVLHIANSLEANPKSTISEKVNPT